MSKLLEALRTKYRSPQEVVLALGLDADILNADKTELANRKEKNMKHRMTRQTAIAVGVLASYIRPKLAADQKFDLRPLFKGVTADNFIEKKPGIVKQINKIFKPKLAKDATIGEISELMDMIQPDVDGDDEVPEALQKNMEKMAQGEAPAKADDASDPVDEIEEFLKGKLSDDDLNHVCSVLRGGGEDEAEAKLKELGSEDEPSEREYMAERIKKEDLKGKGGKDEDPQEEKDNSEEWWRRGKGKAATDEEKDDMKAKDKRAHDQPPSFKGMPVVGKGPMDKKAMDAAIDAASKATEKRVLERQKAIRVAERFVRPWVGDLAMDEATCDNDVYKLALDALDIEVEDVHPSAYKKILELQPKPGEKRQETRERNAVAMDASTTESFASRYPDAVRIRLG